MSPLYKKGEYIALALIALLAVWVITMIAVAVESGSPSTEIEFIHYVIRMTPLFIVCYINASLLTLLAIALFIVLLLIYVKDNRLLSILAFSLVPVYGVMNLFVYVSQFAFLPVLINRFFETSLYPADITVLYNWIQLAPGSTISTINALAYAVLGIPSVLFAVLIIRKGNFAKKAAYYLIANALACFVGVVGIFLGLAFLSIGLVLGGVLFFIAVIYIYLHFLHMEKTGV